MHHGLFPLELSPRAFTTRYAPDTSIVPKLSDVLSDLRELPSPLSDTPRGVPKSQPSPSNLHLTARALRALRRDITRAARENSPPSLTTGPLTTVPQRTTKVRQKLPAKMPDFDRSTVLSTDLSPKLQPSAQHSLAMSTSYITCAPPTAPSVSCRDTIEPAVSANLAPRRL